MFASYEKTSQVILTIFTAMALVLMTACSGGGDESEANDSSDGNTDAPTNTNSAPALTVNSPESGSNYNDETTITFNAVADDEEDGDLSSSIEWSSNLDGVIGTGANITALLSAGDHIITASVTDFGNETTTAEVSLTVSATFGNASLSWNAPYENTDGSDLNDLVSFVIYYGDSIDNMSQSVEVTDTNITSWVIENLTVDRTYYFAITAKNSEGIESEQSVIVTKVING